MFWEEKGEGGHCSHKREISQHKQNACTHTGLSNLPHSQQTKQTVKKKFLLKLCLNWMNFKAIYACCSHNFSYYQTIFFFKLECLFQCMVHDSKCSVSFKKFSRFTYIPFYDYFFKKNLFLTLQPCFKLVKHWNKK